MVNNHDAIRCKTCARVLATVAPTGLTPATPSETNLGCATCQQFSTLFDAVQAADAEWAMLQNKRDSITKSFARENYMRVHMNLDNWLMAVEAPIATKRRNLDQEIKHSDAGVEQANQGIKRRRSHSPSSQQHHSTKDVSDGVAAQQHSAPLSLRPSPKRSRSTTSLPGRKRLMFSPTVEFHENYRSSEEYHRPSETYVRGRNAPPEGSEYMDTSGSGQTFLRFTQMKKVGARWVELSEEELAKKSDGAKVAAERGRLGVVDGMGMQETVGSVVGELQQSEVPSANARTTRSSRRARESLSGGPMQRTNVTTGTRGRGARVSREEGNETLALTNRALAEAREQPSSSVAHALSTLIPTGDDVHSITHENPGATEHIGAADQRLERKDDPSATTVTRHQHNSREEPHTDTCTAGTTVVSLGDASGRHMGDVDGADTGPVGKASCTDWEDAYNAADDGPVAAGGVDQAATSHDDMDIAVAATTAGDQDAASTLTRHDGHDTFPSQETST